MKTIDSYFKKQDSENQKLNSIFNPTKDKNIISKKIRVYTDGACSKNGSKHAKAGIGIFFAEGDPRNVSRRIQGKQTNNTAELKAIIETYRILENSINQGVEVEICSDSKYAIRCCSSYGLKCSRNNWKNEKGETIPNRDLVEIAYNLFKDKKIRFIKVEAHTGKKDIDSIGNDWADKLANQAIGVNTDNKISKIYLKVPYAKKDQIKSIGGKWDPRKKKWYMMSNIYQQKSDLVDSILRS